VFEHIIFGKVFIADHTSETITRVLVRFSYCSYLISNCCFSTLFKTW